MLYDCGWNFTECSRRPPGPADVIHLSYSGNRLVWINMRHDCCSGCCSECHASCQCRFLTALTSWSAKLLDAANWTDPAQGFPFLSSANGISLGLTPEANTRSCRRVEALIVE